MFDSGYQENVEQAHEKPDSIRDAEGYDKRPQIMFILISEKEAESYAQEGGNSQPGKRVFMTFVHFWAFLLK